MSSEYTRGEQVLTPHDVEYLFRAIKTDITSSGGRARSLVKHFSGVDTQAMNQLEIAVSNLISAHSAVVQAERAALGKAFPHRQHAGEDEHW